MLWVNIVKKVYDADFALNMRFWKIQISYFFNRRTYHCLI